MVTQAQNQRNWERGYAPYIDRCRMGFAFLEREHGYGFPEANVTPPEFSIEWRKPGRAVTIVTEYYLPPFLQIYPGDPYRTFGLNEAAAVLEPEILTRHPEVSGGSLVHPDEFGRILDVWSAFLRAHAEEILGDPGPLFDRIAALRGPPPCTPRA